MRKSIISIFVLPAVFLSFMSAFPGEAPKAAKNNEKKLCKERSTSIDIEVRVLNDITCGRVNNAKIELESALKKEQEDPVLHAISGFLARYSGPLEHIRRWGVIDMPYEFGDEDKKGSKYYETAGNLFLKNRNYQEALFCYLSSKQYQRNKNDFDLINTRFQDWIFKDSNKELLNLFSVSPEAKSFFSTLFRSEILILKKLLYPPPKSPTLEESIGYEVAVDYAIAKMKCDGLSRKKALSTLRRATEIFKHYSVVVIEYNVVLGLLYELNGEHEAASSVYSVAAEEIDFTFKSMRSKALLSRAIALSKLDVKYDNSSPLTTTPPTSTNVPISLSKIDLEPILILRGDLPVGLSGGRTRDSLPEMFAGLPKAKNQIYQQFQREGNATGGVAVILYEAQKNVDDAYTFLQKSFGEPISKLGVTFKREQISDFGERAEALSIQGTLFGTKFDSTELVFVRCRAVVHIRLTGTPNLPEIVTYARQLDERLSVILCR